MKANRFRLRAWSAHHGEMHHNATYDPEYETDINPWIYMQSTGLVDKNDKEIFEGDVVRGRLYPSGDDLDWPVVWDGMCFVLCTECKELDGGEEPVACHNNHMTVIGNIHENPELLTKEA